MKDTIKNEVSKDKINALGSILLQLAEEWFADPDNMAEYEGRFQQEVKAS